MCMKETKCVCSNVCMRKCVRVCLCVIVDIPLHCSLDPEWWQWWLGGDEGLWQEGGFKGSICYVVPPSYTEPGDIVIMMRKAIAECLD